VPSCAVGDWAGAPDVAVCERGDADGPVRRECGGQLAGRVGWGLADAAAGEVGAPGTAAVAGAEGVRAAATCAASV